MAPVRSHTAENKEVVTYGGAVGHSWHKREPNQSVSMTIRLDPKYNAHLPPVKNPANPPYHWHLKQREDFRIQQGSVIFTVDGKDITKTKADGLLSLQPKTYHTFRADPNSPEEIIMLVTAQPEDGGITERFFRNIYGYNEDCIEQKLSPNICQIFLFLDSSDTYPVLPGPKFIAQPLSRFLTYFLGTVIGKHILGLKESYDEYYKPTE